MKCEMKSFFRVSADGNCLFRAISMALIGKEELASSLRCLTAAELYSNASWYASIKFFDELSQSLTNVTSNSLFVEAMTDIGCEMFASTKDRVISLQAEANHISKNFNWASFVCVMAVASVIQVIFYF